MSDFHVMTTKSGRTFTPLNDYDVLEEIYEDMGQDVHDWVAERILEINVEENIAQQKYAHAKADYEASLKRGGGMDGKELRQREQALQMYKQLYEKAQKYAESAKKMYQNIHGETDRVIWMTTRQRDKLEKSKEEGDNFLKKAIAALNEYTE